MGGGTYENFIELIGIELGAPTIDRIRSEFKDPKYISPEEQQKKLNELFDQIREDQLTTYTDPQGRRLKRIYTGSDQFRYVLSDTARFDKSGRVIGGVTYDGPVNIAKRKPSRGREETQAENFRKAIQKELFDKVNAPRVFSDSRDKSLPKDERRAFDLDPLFDQYRKSVLVKNTEADVRVQKLGSAILGEKFLSGSEKKEFERLKSLQKRGVELDQEEMSRLNTLEFGGRALSKNIVFKQTNKRIDQEEKALEDSINRGDVVDTSKHLSNLMTIRESLFKAGQVSPDERDWFFGKQTTSDTSLEANRALEAFNRVDKLLNKHYNKDTILSLRRGENLKRDLADQGSAELSQLGINLDDLQTEEQIRNAVSLFNRGKPKTEKIGLRKFESSREDKINDLVFFSGSPAQRDIIERWTNAKLDNEWKKNFKLWKSKEQKFTRSLFDFGTKDVDVNEAYVSRGLPSPSEEEIIEMRNKVKGLAPFLSNTEREKRVNQLLISDVARFDFTIPELAIERRIMKKLFNKDPDTPFTLNDYKKASELSQRKAFFLAAGKRTDVDDDTIPKEAVKEWLKTAQNTFKEDGVFNTRQKEWLEKTSTEEETKVADDFIDAIEGKEE